MKKRENWIDILKGFGALFILLGHVVNNTSYIKVYLYSFHIPLFFFVSGYLFNRKPNIYEHIKEKFKRFVIPYFIFSFISFEVFTLFNDNNMDKLEIIKGFFFLNGSNPWNSSLWFLIIIFFTLIIMNLLFNIDNMVGFKKKYKRAIYLIILLLVNLLLLKYNVKLYFGLEIVPHMLLISYIGYIIKEQKYLDRINYSLKLKTFIIPLFFIGIFLAIYNGRVNVSTSVYNNYFLYLLVSFINLFVYICFSKCWPNIKLLKTACSLSMFMFCTQRILFMFYYAIQIKYDIVLLNSENLLISFSVFLCTLMLYYIGYFITIRIKRFFIKEAVK